MGGNALKNVETRRIPKAEYEQMWKEVSEAFYKMDVLPCDLHLIESYASKADFGDMDILITKKGSKESEWSKEIGIRGILEQVFNSKEVVLNGNCVSFEYKGFQIDLISCPYDEFHMSAVYFAYNDLGNLIGKTARNLHMKYGHSGLAYVVRDGIGEKLAEVPISKDPKQIFAFLGYDWERWKRGFNDLEEIFQFAVSSPYFTPESYALENLNYTDRVRDKKRSTYTAFLKWVEERKPESTWVRSKDRKSELNRAFSAFPDFRRRYREALARVEKIRQVKINFNGDRVSRLLGLSGKELGSAMAEFRNSFKTIEEFQDFVLYSDASALDSEIRTVWTEFTHSHPSVV